MKTAKDTRFKKGMIPWNKGIPCSEDTKLKIVATLKGKMNRELNPNWKGGLPKCENCGKQLGTYGYQKCRSCSHLGLQNSLGATPWNKGKKYPQISGENNWNWKGGITPLNNKIRHLIEYNLWKQSIFQRDDYRCQSCGRRSNVLHADHFPKTFASIIKENNVRSIEEAINCEKLWDMGNARTLCFDCHKETTTYLNNHNVRRSFYEG